jgi:hypothetical protein
LYFPKEFFLFDCNQTNIEKWNKTIYNLFDLIIYFQMNTKSTYNFFYYQQMSRNILNITELGIAYENIINFNIQLSKLDMEICNLTTQYINLYEKLYIKVHTPEWNLDKDIELNFWFELLDVKK